MNKKDSIVLNLVPEKFTFSQFRQKHLFDWGIISSGLNWDKQIFKDQIEKK